MRVLALVKYGRRAASTRQRFLQYEPFLAAAGFTVDYAPLLGDAYLERLVDGRRPSLLSVAAAYGARLARLLTARRYDLLWVHYELFPYFPGLAERLAALAGRPIIYDFDDAIFHNYDASPQRLVRRLLGRKLEPLLRSAYACCCGNPYLRDYAIRYCPNSIILPTVVDTDLYVPSPTAKAPGQPVTIGWIGSPSTWPLVRPYLKLLAELCSDGTVEVRAVGAGIAAEADRFPGLHLVAWTEQREIAEVQKMDIGIMPVWDGPFQRGKSGYKLIQYMACGLPVVASPVGVNRDIIVDGDNGFLANSDADWRAALTRLIDDPQLRRRLGDAGRLRAERDLSLASQAPRLVEVFRSAGRVV